MISKRESRTGNKARLGAIAASIRDAIANLFPVARPVPIPVPVRPSRAYPRR